MSKNKMEKMLNQKLEISDVVEERISETYQLIRKKAVQQQSGTAGRKRKIPRFVFPLAAALALAGGAAIALELPFDMEWMGRMGVNQEMVEEMIDTNPEITYLTEEPPISIETFYVDGRNLVFTATAGKEIDYILYAKDNAVVNETDCLLYFYFVNKQNDIAYYQGEISLPEAMEGDEVEISIRLYMQDEIREVSFRTKTEGLQMTRWIPDQIFELDYADIEVTGISISPSELQMTMDYSFDDYEKAKESEWQLLYKLEDDKGTVLDTMYGNAGYASDIVEEDGKWTFRSYLSISGFDFESEYVKVTPYTPQTNSEGEAIPDTGTVHEEKSFTVSLTGEEN